MKKSIIFLITAIFAFAILPLNLIKTKNDVVYADDYRSQGIVLNAVVYVSFADGNSEAERTSFESFDSDFFGKIRRMYNNESSLSVKNYYLKQSNGKLVVETTFFGENNPIKLDNTADYYKPKYIWKNNRYEETDAKEGYDNRLFNERGECVGPMDENAKESIDGYIREQALIREVSSKCNVQGYNGDYNGDGELDSIVFITDAGKNDDLSDNSWGEVLWSHMGVAHNFPQSILKNYYYTEEQLEQAKSLSEPRFGYSLISKYNFLSAGEICKNIVEKNSAILKGTEDGGLFDVGLLCHEMAHNLGLYDLYSYENLNYESVGEFDVLANYTPVPQNMLAYTRYKMGWIDYDDILYINSTGQYTLPFSRDGYACAKIVLSNYLDTGEYFILEARSKDYATKDDPYDSCLTGSGLIIYRVSETNAYNKSSNPAASKGNVYYGNMYGADEVYVYRIPANDGSVNKLSQKNLLINYSTALLGTSLSSTGVQSFGASQYVDAKTIIDYSDGSNSFIVVNSISENDDKDSVKGMSFNVSLRDEPKTPVITMGIQKCLLRDFYDGSKRLDWLSNVSDGKAYVLALRSTNRLKRLAESNKASITFEDIKKGSFSNYKTLFATSLPIAELHVGLPEFEDSAMIFFALESSGGLRSIRYAGEIELENESFYQRLVRVFDPIYIFAVIAVFLLIILVILLIFGGRHTLMNKN